MELMDSLKVRIPLENHEPIPYELREGGTLMIHPILLKDYLTYSNCTRILEIDKDACGIEAIQMSYFRFLVEKVLRFDDTKVLISNLLYIIEKCLAYTPNRVNFVYDDRNKPMLCLYDEHNVLEKIVSQKEFDDIRKMILSQNNPSYEDLEYSDDIKELVQMHYSTHQGNGYNPPLDKQKAYVTSKTGIVAKELNEMTYREFFYVFRMCSKTDEFHAKKILQASEKYKIDDDMTLPIYKPEESILDSIFSKQSPDELQSKIEGLV